MELMRLQEENKRLRGRLQSLRPGGVRLSPDMFSIHNHKVEKIQLTRCVWSVVRQTQDAQTLRYDYAQLLSERRVCCCLWRR